MILELRDHHPAAPATVGILVTSHNRRQLLQSALESAVRQTYPHFHLAIVDDASTDGSVEAIRGFAERYPGQVTAIFKQARTGMTDSFNRGLAALRHLPYVAFLDDDDIWEPDKLRRQVEQFDQCPSLGLVFTEATIIDADSQPTGQLFSDIFGSPDLEEPATHLFSRGMFVCRSSAVVSTEALAVIDFRYDLGHGVMSDTFMWQVISAHMAIAYISEPLTRYRRSASSVSVSHPAIFLRESYENRLLALRRFRRVQDAVGGERVGLAILDDYAMYWAINNLRAGNYREYAWYARRLLQRRVAPLAVRLTYETLRGVAARQMRRLAGRLRRRT